MALDGRSTCLSPDDLIHYKEKGYIVVKGCVPPADLERYHARFLARLIFIKFIKRIFEKIIIIEL